jgi:SAM-dependent methyltransferase
MTLALDDLDFLASDAGARVLERLYDEDLGDDHTLRLITHLRRELAPQQAGAALELARLRKKAVAKFGDDAARMYFTREALEQASAPSICNWRAVTFVTREDLRVVDACCGIGADSLAFARAGAQVIGLDIDPLRVEMARLNASALGIVNARFEVADVRAFDSLPDADLIFFDPGRRDRSGRRVFDVEDYKPPLSTIRAWRAGQIVVKISPGVEIAQLTQYLDEGARVSFVSADGDLKEALLVLGGRLVGAAVLLENGAVHVWHEHWADATVAEAPRKWLVEPDPALIRAGLVADAAEKFGGALLDPEIAYITTEEQPVSPWVRAWRILDWMPFNLKKLRAYLREQGVGSVTVKKRGTAVTPEELIAKLKLDRGINSGSRTIVLTRCRGEHIMIICDDICSDFPAA